MRCHVAGAADEGLRLDVVLGQIGAYASRSAAARAIEDGRVQLNGSIPSKRASVHSGDAIVYEVDEVVARPTELVGEEIPLDIRYEDDDLIVLSKQAGLICHPCDGHKTGTLVHALIHHCGADHLCNVQGDLDRLGIVHRLDMDTSGLMLAAKTDECGNALMEAIRERSVDRRYLALVHGIIPRDTGIVDAPIARHPKDRTRMSIRDCPSARDAVTTFTVLERFEAGIRDSGYTLIECKLFTGRTHQIRIHMEYTRHPVVGDPIYRAHMPKHELANLGLNRQFLHSYRLAFEHPSTGEEMSFEDALPADLQQVLDGLADRKL